MSFRTHEVGYGAMIWRWLGWNGAVHLGTDRWDRLHVRSLNLAAEACLRLNNLCAREW